MKVSLPFNYQLRVYFSRLEKRQGVGSQVFNGGDKHILLWDFDNKKLSSVIGSLLTLQQHYKLPSIYIISTSINRYHAYSFTARSFREVIHILSDTPEIDVAYLRLGVARGYYTLRVSKRKGENFRLVKILTSVLPDEVNPLDVSISEYLTLNKGGK